MNKGYVYILASKKDWVLYTWVTNNLSRRIFEHKDNTSEWFTNKYIVKKLVYFEQYDDIRYAILREKQLKKWKRDWKIKLIEEENLERDDLYDNLY